MYIQTNSHPNIFLQKLEPIRIENDKQYLLEVNLDALTRKGDGRPRECTKDGNIKQLEKMMRKRTFCVRMGKNGFIMNSLLRGSCYWC